MLDELTHDRGEKRPGIVPGEHRGVRVVVREARGISAFSAEIERPRP
jgi:hypothetical protein